MAAFLVLAAAAAGLVPGGHLIAGAEAPASALPSAPFVYRPPTDGPVVDPFRPPPQPWLPGNRGIEYDTAVGAPVLAIGPGVVAFAGQVAGRLVVTIDHPGGLRSSYVDLAGIAVERGARVQGGQVVGLAADRLHLGVRRGGSYLDPASLWGTRAVTGRVRLVPVGGGAAGFRRAAGTASGGLLQAIARGGDG